MDFGSRRASVCLADRTVERAIANMGAKVSRDREDLGFVQDPFLRIAGTRKPSSCWC